MIKAIIFDFGNVFINLDIEGAMKNALNHFKIKSFTEEMIRVNKVYEQGLISTHTFLKFYLEKFPELTEDNLINIWNFMLKDFPRHRLVFLKKLKENSKYKLILLSNTNELHINWIKENVPFYESFKNCFEAFYLSHEIHLSKPNENIYEFVLKENNLKANECFFIDDNKENIMSAEKLGIHVWNINPSTEDVSTFFEAKKYIFD